MKKMISRRDFLKVAGISAAALGLAACGGSGTSTAASTASTAASTGSSAAASGSAVTLKLGFSTNEEDPRAKGAKQFAEEVAEKTGGAVEVQLYPSGQLGGDADLINRSGFRHGGYHHHRRFQLCHLRCKDGHFRTAVPVRDLRRCMGIHGQRHRGCR